MMHTARSNVNGGTEEGSINTNATLVGFPFTLLTAANFMVAWSLGPDPR